MDVLVDDSAETVLPFYGEAFDLVGFERLGQGPQGWLRRRVIGGSVLVVVPLVLPQRTP